MKKRVDVLLVERGLVPTRARAQALILGGQVLSGDTPIEKAGQLLDLEAPLRLRGEDLPYVSRGGLKLEAALKAFQIPVSGKAALDVGASTGGFTDVLLQGGAAKVYALDAGQNQLDWRIRSNPRVVSLEKTNVRYIEFGLIGQKVDIITVDVSFISLEKIFGPLLPFATPSTDWITLIKPQFEVGKGKVGKGGIVRNEQDRQEVIERILGFAESHGLRRLGLIESPITGSQGNQEYLAHWKLT